MRHLNRSTLRRIAVLAFLAVAAMAIAGCSSPSPTTTTSSAGASRGSAAAPAADSALKAPVPNEIAGAPAAAGGSSSAPASTPVPDASKLVIVDKTLRLEAADVTKALDQIRGLAKTAGGDIVSLQVATSSDQPIYRPQPADGGSASTDQQAGPLKAYVTVRVPGATYQTFVAEAAKLGRVLYQSESTQDVTQQHVDLKARLGNLQAEIVRLRAMFNKARNISEMLQVEQELARVQGEAEALKAQIDYLERQAAMATVTIELAEPQAIVRPAGTDWGVGAAVTTSIRAFVDTLNVIIVVIGPVLALGLFFVLPVLLVIWLIRRRSARRRAGPAVPPASPLDESSAESDQDAGA
jgi:hypothetical protein